MAVIHGDHSGLRTILTHQDRLPFRTLKVRSIGSGPLRTAPRYAAPMRYPMRIFSLLARPTPHRPMRSCCEWKPRSIPPGPRVETGSSWLPHRTSEETSTRRRARLCKLLWGCSNPTVRHLDYRTERSAHCRADAEPMESTSCERPF
jgi:hypothetical protein